ncbi:MAG: hypothetical protein V1740_06255 [Candidatus Woesearchaeota archaeon]
MMQKRIRKVGEGHSLVKKCPNCGHPILHETVATKGGDFCRKCGYFFGIKPDADNLGGYQQENLE